MLQLRCNEHTISKLCRATQNTTASCRIHTCSAAQDLQCLARWLDHALRKHVMHHKLMLTNVHFLQCNAAYNHIPVEAPMRSQDDSAAPLCLPRLSTVAAGVTCGPRQQGVAAVGAHPHVGVARSGGTWGMWCGLTAIGQYTPGESDDGNLAAAESFLHPHNPPGKQRMKVPRMPCTSQGVVDASLYTFSFVHMDLLNVINELKA